jgi:hypothetical protein
MKLIIRPGASIHVKYPDGKQSTYKAWLVSTVEAEIKGKRYHWDGPSGPDTTTRNVYSAARNDRNIEVG